MTANGRDGTVEEGERGWGGVAKLISSADEDVDKDPRRIQPNHLSSLSHI